MRFSAGLCAALAAAALGACAPLGPITVARDRTLYNESLQKTDAQQLLLNIVRQRYNDPVMFLDVTSLSSSITRSASAGLFVLAPDVDSGSLGAEIEESPTVYYAPSTGEAFVRQMLTPLDLRTITLVLQSGWSIERVLLLTGESVNAMRNLDPTSASVDRGYANLASDLRDLQRAGDLTLGIDGPGDDDAAVTVTLAFAPQATSTAAYRRVCAALAVPCDGGRISMRHGIGAPEAGSQNVLFSSRSLFSAMFYLAQGVELPPDDVARGVVAPARGPDGQAVDWLDLRRELFVVRSAAAEPENAHVKVFYRNTWFYIPDNDIDTKTTFALMSMLVMLQSGGDARIAPLLTLPAGG